MKVFPLTKLEITHDANGVISGINCSRNPDLAPLPNQEKLEADLSKAITSYVQRWIGE